MQLSDHSFREPELEVSKTARSEGSSERGLTRAILHVEKSYNRIRKTFSWADEEETRLLYLAPLVRIRAQRSVIFRP